jgi:hypothetical protein
MRHLVMIFHCVKIDLEENNDGMTSRTRRRLVIYVIVHAATFFLRSPIVGNHHGPQTGP